MLTGVLTDFQYNPIRNEHQKYMTDTLQKRFEICRDGIVVWGNL